jgi:predicted amidophosphoribosyltransferase
MRFSGVASELDVGGAARLLDLLVPERCAACGAGEALVCGPCRAALVRLVAPLCARCGAPTAWPVECCAECAGRRLPFRTARAAVAYQGPARSLVVAWKERAVRGVGAEAAALVTAVVPRPEVEAVVFVAGEPERTLWRGLNTAEALARELAERWNTPLLAALARPRRGARQRGLARPVRRANVRGAFRAIEPVPRRVALVDDVYTTGATVASAATELRRAGARAVDVVTFARAVRTGA